LVELRRARANLPPEVAIELDRVLSAVGGHFQSDAAHPPVELLASIDACLSTVAAYEGECPKQGTLLGLTDLRRGLFPDAPPYQPGGSKTLKPELAV
jgi:hypothetical protein